MGCANSNATAGINLMCSACSIICKDPDGICVICQVQVAKQDGNKWECKTCHVIGKPGMACSICKKYESGLERRKTIAHERVPRDWFCQCCEITNKQREKCTECNSPQYLDKDPSAKPKMWKCTYCSADNSDLIQKCHKCWKEQNARLSAKESLTDCKDCLEVFDNEKDHCTRLECGHVVHTECQKDILETFLQGDRKTMRDTYFRCPVSGCKKVIGDVTANRICKDNVMKEKFKKLKQERDTRALKSVKGYYKCPTPECPGFFIVKGETTMDCKKCKETICVMCEVKMHKGMSCDAYQKKHPEVAIAGMANCYHCNKKVAKAVGCNHIECPGSTHAFCFTCSGPYPKCFCGKYDPDKPRILQDCAPCLALLGTQIPAKEINRQHAEKPHPKTASEKTPECTTCTQMWQKGIDKKKISESHRKSVKLGTVHKQ